MVFAGEADDPGTLETLAGMGYKRPADVIAGVRGWHHGRYPAVRSPRARELLTDLTKARSTVTDRELSARSYELAAGVVHPREADHVVADLTRTGELVALEGDRWTTRLS